MLEGEAVGDWEDSGGSMPKLMKIWRKAPGMRVICGLAWFLQNLIQSSLLCGQIITFTRACSATDNFQLWPSPLYQSLHAELKICIACVHAEAGLLGVQSCCRRLQPCIINPQVPEFLPSLTCKSNS